MARVCQSQKFLKVWRGATRGRAAARYSEGRQVDAGRTVLGPLGYLFPYQPAKNLYIGWGNFFQVLVPINTIGFGTSE
eukprot:SAG11_NODE_2464_length_3326_cov_7.981097_2_plen_78_part_00